MEVNVHHARTHLFKLIAAAEASEEVIIARNGKPAVKLVLAVTEAAAKSTPAKLLDRVFEQLAGKIILPPNWEKEWEDFDNEIADLMINGPILTTSSPASGRQNRKCAENPARHQCSYLGLSPIRAPDTPRQAGYG